MSRIDESRNLSAAQLHALLADQAVILVDVREPAEYAAEHIAGALCHPLSRFDPQALPPGDLVLQCGIGKRSLMALQICAAAGHRPVRHLAGGLAAWKQAGYPTQPG